MTNWTRERYGERDFVGSELDRENIDEPVQAVFEYNQDEFKDNSYYCGAYGCFDSWSSYTWKEVPYKWRKEFIQACLSDGTIVDDSWGRLDEIVDKFTKFISKKTGFTRRYARTKTYDKDIHSRWFVLVTWFNWNKKFKEDRQDNCIIDNIDWWTWQRWHCIWEYDYHTIQDNYKGRKCNIYSVTDFDWYVNNWNHFTYWYFFYSVNNPQMGQFEQDIKDIELALELWFTNNKQELEDIRRWTYTQDNKTTLKVTRAYKKLLQK